MSFDLRHSVLIQLYIDIYACVCVLRFLERKDTYPFLGFQQFKNIVIKSIVLHKSLMVGCNDTSFQLFKS